MNPQKHLVLSFSLVPVIEPDKFLEFPRFQRQLPMVFCLLLSHIIVIIIIIIVIFTIDGLAVIICLSHARCVLFFAGSPPLDLHAPFVILSWGACYARMMSSVVTRFRAL